MTLRLGKRPATHDDRDLLFARYATEALPTPPAQFGHETLVGAKAWGMLGNDEWGDCAWAGPAHETMLLTAEASAEVAFTTASVLSDYSAGTGFNQHAGPPGDNPTDQGSNVRDVLAYRAKTGILDAHGKRHKIGAYVKLDHSNVAEIYQALYLFETVGIGINFPNSAMDQFNRGQPWSVVPGSSIEGGHYVPIVARRSNFEVVTWGALQQMTAGFLTTYCDEAWAYVSVEDLHGGRSLEGFDLAQLQADLAELPVGS